MHFRYFAAPIEEIFDLCQTERACSLCGGDGPCFELRFATCLTVSDRQKKDAVGCYVCLREGRFEFCHDTELGLVDENGLSDVCEDNMPPPDGFAEGALAELRRTPQFISWQQACWLVHCNDFMEYLGIWEPDDFYENADDGDGRALFREMTDPGDWHIWDESLRADGERLESWDASYYVFRCLHCSKLRGNWDCG